MAKRRKPKCTVVFETGRLGPSAVLMWHGRSLNATSFRNPPTARQKTAARKRLLRGCAELVRDYRRSDRRDRRG